MKVSESLYYNSPQWTYASFRLKLILSHPNIQILSVQKNISNNASFLAHQQLESYLKTEAAVDVSNQNLEVIDGIRNNTEKNVIFKCGRIQQDVHFSTTDHLKKYRVMMMKVAINQVLPIQKSSSIKNEDYFEVIEDQYDTIYLAEKRQQLSVFNHDYLLKKTTQYIWQYDIEYMYTDPQNQQFQFKEWSADHYQCENCKEKPAKYYCEDQKEIYCMTCYNDLHRTYKKSQHQKQLLTPYNCTSYCQKPLHGDKLEFYCFQCKSLKCKRCLSDKIHHDNSNENVNSGKNVVEPFLSNNSQKKKQHQVIEIRKLAILFKEKEKELCLEAKSAIASKIKEIQNKIILINNHYDIKLKQFQRIFAERVSILKEETTQELNRAVGVHTELKRKFDEFLWMETFMQHVEDYSDAINCIKMKEGLTAYMNQISAQQYFKFIDKKIIEIKIFS